MPCATSSSHYRRPCRLFTRGGAPRRAREASSRAICGSVRVPDPLRDQAKKLPVVVQTKLVKSLLENTSGEYKSDRSDHDLARSVTALH